MNYVTAIFDIIGVIGILVFLLTYRNALDAINRRIDGIHERIDTLRDFMMQRHENDIKDIKDKLHKELQ